MGFFYISSLYIIAYHHRKCNCSLYCICNSMGYWNCPKIRRQQFSDKIRHIPCTVKWPYLKKYLDHSTQTLELSINMAIEHLIKYSAKSETKARGALVDFIWNDPHGSPVDVGVVTMEAVLLQDQGNTWRWQNVELNSFMVVTRQGVYRAWYGE